MLTKQKIDVVLSEINLKLKDTISSYAGIYLIGSNSGREINQSSDVDIVVVLNKSKIDFKLKHRIVDIIYDIQIKHEIVLDIKVYTKNDILNPTTPFRANVQQGSMLYVS